MDQKVAATPTRSCALVFLLQGCIQLPIILCILLGFLTPSATFIICDSISKNAIKEKVFNRLCVITKYTLKTAMPISFGQIILDQNYAFDYVP